MKQLNMIGGKTYELEDDEAKNVSKLWEDGSSLPIELRNGTRINPRCIESIGEIIGRKIEDFVPPVKEELSPEDRKNNMERLRILKNKALNQ